MLSTEQIASLDFEKSGGLVTAVVQCADSARVLMVGYANDEALRVTLSTGRVTFFSRSKNRLWTKGESSGHFLQLVDAQIDCDRDAILLLARPQGPTCHNGTTSCFDGAFDRSAGSPISFLSDLDQLILDRKKNLPPGSYTTKLFTGELRRIAQKVGEEGVETALAATLQDDEALIGEAGDLLFHLLVLLRARDLGLQDVITLLKSRHGKSNAG
jgi:phosphoribosyl-AMP cyclohydrolase / phosphoribosyl-ATP pyrophosphohydrolase